MSRVPVDFDQERAWWDGKAPQEEVDLADERINRLLRWRILERNLDGVSSVLEIGGGTGAFSIPLAQRGLSVVHVDFSPAMLARAREKAKGLQNLRLVQANAVDLRDFADRSFDLVLNMDGAISFCGSAAERAIGETCRVALKKTIVAVSNTAWMIPVLLMDSVESAGHFIPAVYEIVEEGFWHRYQFPENELIIKEYFGTLKSFLPNELKAQIETNGLIVSEVRAVGSLANLSAKVVDKILKDPHLLEKFLNLCEDYDTRVDPMGPGTRQRAGLIAIARRDEQADRHGV
jgi:ubiquinone/menaquinone biosynthesis C-methylase UbiE